MTAGNTDFATDAQADPTKLPAPQGSETARIRAVAGGLPGDPHGRGHADGGLQFGVSPGRTRERVVADL